LDFDEVVVVVSVDNLVSYHIPLGHRFVLVEIVYEENLAEDYQA
jgi:hypothetical protein